MVTLIDVVGPIGGAERLATLTATRLDPARFESILCVSRWRRDDPDRALMAAAVEEIEAAGVSVFGLGRSGKADVWVWGRLVRELRRRRVDVLHAHKFGSNVWASIVGTAARTPVVVAHEHSWAAEGGRLRHALDRHLIARAADAFVACSREDRRRMIELEGIPPEVTHLIPNGAPRSAPPSGHDVRAELGVAPDAPVVVALGRLTPVKAFDVLVDAAARLRERHPAARVLIVGEGEERAALESRIAGHGLGDAVLLLGHRTDVADVLRACDVAVCCSDSEGMPVSVIEEMEAGLPIVATRVGGLPDLVDDGVHGLLVEPRDPDGLAKAIGDLLADPAAARAMGERARQRRESEFDIDVMVRRIEELYGGLLARRRAMADRTGPSANSSQSSLL